MIRSECCECGHKILIQPADIKSLSHWKGYCEECCKENAYPAITEDDLAVIVGSRVVPYEDKYPLEMKKVSSCEECVNIVQAETEEAQITRCKVIPNLNHSLQDIIKCSEFQERRK